MGGGRGGRSPPGWGWGKGSFPGEKTWRTSRDSVYVEGRVLMVEVKLRAKASRWDQMVQGRELGRLRGQELRLQEARW